jgi:hypothetical protein
VRQWRIVGQGKGIVMNKESPCYQKEASFSLRKFKLKEEFTSKIAAKLLKLMISKFDGSLMNWPKFWGQYTEAIVQSHP